MQLRNLVHATLGATALFGLLALPDQASAFCPASVNDIEGEGGVAEELNSAALESIGPDARRQQCHSACNIAHTGCNSIKAALRACEQRSNGADNGLFGVVCAQLDRGDAKQQCNEDKRESHQSNREELNEDSTSARETCNEAHQDCRQACEDITD